MTQQLRIHTHAQRRMRQRGAFIGDIEHACLSAERAVGQANGRWRLDGQDLDGDELTVIAAIEANVVVVTLF